MSSYGAGTMATTSQTRPYQGFPYTNPNITDAPTMDRSVTDQWANLPRRQLNATPKLTLDASRPPPVAEASTDTSEAATPDYVRDTILYNQFDDRRIDINHETAGERAKSQSPSVCSAADSEESYPRIYVPQIPQDSFDYEAPSSSHRSPAAPGFMGKEASIYQPNRQDSFNLTPIPVSEFPAPPPAYSEIDTVRHPASVAIPLPEVASEPPRTQVIVPSRVAEPPRTLTEDRHALKCPHCDKQVNTIVIREAGVATHVAAWIFFLFLLFPVTILIYCTDYCKYKNHYCPECSKLVGYEIPLMCQDFVYA